MNTTKSQTDLQIFRKVQSDMSAGIALAMEMFNEQIADLIKDKEKEFEKVLKERFAEVMEEMKGEISAIKPADGKTPKKFEDYFTPTEISDIVSVAVSKAKPKKGLDYVDGKDAKTPTKEEFIQMMKPYIPKIRDGKDGTSGVDGKNGIDGSPDSPIEIVGKINTLNEVIDIRVIKGLTKKLDDITMLLRERKRKEVKLGGHGGDGGGPAGDGLTRLTATGTVNGSNTNFDFTEQPDFIISDGIWYEVGVGFTWASTTATMSVAPTYMIRGLKIG